VVWKWEWEDDNVDHVSETSSEGFSANNPDLESCSDENEGIADEDKSEEEDNSNKPRCKPIHTVNALELHVLRTHRKIWREPAYYLMKTNNMFQLYLLNLTIQRMTKLLLFDDSWNIIGYIVTETLESAHFACDQGRITSVEFSWINFTWPRSGPAIMLV